MLLRTLRSTVRSAFRHPRSSVPIIALIAIGVGVNAAVIRFADDLLVRPPPGVTAAHELRRIYLRTRRTPSGVEVMRSAFTYRQFKTLQRTQAASIQLAAYTAPDTIVDSDTFGPAAFVSHVSSNYFGLVGARILIGRSFAPDDDRMGDPTDVALLSFPFWQRQFAGDTAVIGRTIRLGSRRIQIIGVVAQPFLGLDLDATNVWLPLSSLREAPVGSDAWYSALHSQPIVRLVGRMVVPDADARIESSSTVVLRQAAADGSRPDTTLHVLVGSIVELQAPAPRTPAVVLIARRLVLLALIMLVIVCGNVANLFLARRAQHQRELAICAALGLTPARMLRQFATESLTLAFAAALFATGLATWCTALLRRSIMPGVHWGTPAFDYRILALAAGLCLFVGLVSSVPVALRVGRHDLATLVSGRPGLSEKHGARLRTAILLTQTALSLFLLIAAGVFMRSFQQLRAIDLGYDVDQLILATVSFRDPHAGYIDPFGSAHETELAQGLGQAATALQNTPGIRNVAVASGVPLQGYALARVYMPGSDSTVNVSGQSPAIFAVSPTYFATTGIRLVRGRTFAADANLASAPIVLINETGARELWPGRNPIGQCVVLGESTAPCRTVIGIVRDVHLLNVIEEAGPCFYVPAAQAVAGAALGMPRVLVASANVKSRAPAIAAIRRALSLTFPDADHFTVTPLSAIIAPQLQPWRVGSVLFSALGALALLVALLGVYSIVAHFVAQRSRDIGIRIALGAVPGDILRHVLVETCGGVALGIACGLLLVWAAGRVAAPLLYDTSPYDPLIVTTASVLLFGIAVLVALVPAWRCSRIDPLDVILAA